MVAVKKNIMENEEIKKKDDFVPNVEESDFLKEYNATNMNKKERLTKK